MCQLNKKDSVCFKSPSVVVRSLSQFEMFAFVVFCLPGSREKCLKPVWNESNVSEIKVSTTDPASRWQALVTWC